MLYKLIIVDDDENIREGLKRRYDWARLGFEVAALFEDGRDAMEYLARKPVDVVLTDIVMCESSGLDVAHFIRERDLRVKCVLLSGYREFEYAREAVCQGAFQYLLKPVDGRELRATFLALQDVLNRERAREGDPSFAYLGAEGYERIDALIERILRADASEPEQAFAKYAAIVRAAPENVAFSVELQLMERAYERLGECLLDDRLDKEGVYARFDALESEERLELLRALVDKCADRSDFLAAAALRADAASPREAARRMNVSLRSFQRTFKQRMGVSYSEHVGRSRMEHAQALLRAGGHTLKEVAFEAGFGDYKYFLKCFKKHTGRTPGEYMRGLRSEDQ